MRRAGPEIPPPQLKPKAFRARGGAAGSGSDWIRNCLHNQEERREFIGSGDDRLEPASDIWASRHFEPDWAAPHRVTENDPMPKMSAGLLAYKKPAQGPPEVLLVHPGGPFWKHKDAHSWSVPKGEYGSGDEPEREAEREFTEELGQPAPKGPRLELGSVRQSGGKVVRVWAVEVDDISVGEIQSNSFEMEWPPKSGRKVRFPEVDRAEWMTIPQARDRLVKGQVEFLDRLLDVLDRQA